MRVQIENRKELLWITLPEIITMENIIEVQKRVELKLSENVERVVLDLSNMKSISSISISLFLKIRVMALKRELPFCLINISGECLDQMESIHIDDMFPIFKDEEALVGRHN